MNGKIVEYGKKHYIRTPLNLTFTNLVKAISHKNSNSRSETKIKQKALWIFDVLTNKNFD